jgi:hypothetical protein
MQKRYRTLGKMTFRSEESQNESSKDWVGDAHTVDEALRNSDGPLQLILDGITRGYSDFEITVKGRKP